MPFLLYMLRTLRCLHRVEELLLDDFSILSRIETCFVHGHAFPRVFWRDVILETHDEAVATVILGRVSVHQRRVTVAWSLRDRDAGDSDARHLADGHLEQ